MRMCVCVCMRMRARLHDSFIEKVDLNVRSTELYIRTLLIRTFLIRTFDNEYPRNNRIHACIFLSRANHITFSPSQGIRVIHAIEYKFRKQKIGIIINIEELKSCY